MTDFDRWNGDGRGTLAERLPRVDVPLDLEHRVRATLGRQRLVRQGHRAVLVWSVRLGLVAAGFALGLVLNARTGGEGRASASTSAPRYVLLLYGQTAGDTGSVHAAREREYGQWASALSGGVRWVGGDELHDLVSSIGPGVSDAAPAASDRLAGYFVIEASSPALATAAARACPHVKYGGRVVVMAVAS